MPSVTVAKWGVLHLEGDEKARAIWSPNGVEVQQGNKLYIFSVKHGEWSKGVAVKRLPPQARKGTDVRNAFPKGAPERLPGSDRIRRKASRRLPNDALLGP